MKKIEAEFELKTGKTKKDLSDIADGVNDVKTGLNNVTTQGKKSIKVLRGIKNLFKGALGLGIVIKAFDILKETFMANQKVADTFATVMETISLVFNQVVNAVVKGNGEFNALGKVLTNVLNIGLAPFKLAFEGISIAIMSAQKAFLQFTGGSKERIAELTLGIIEAKAAAVDIGEGVIDSGKAIVENFGTAVDSIKEISITAAYETAKANVELEKSAEVAAVVNQGLIEKYDRQAEQQRQIRDDETKTMEERIAANTELGRILDEQSEKMLENVDLQIKSAQAQYDKNSSQENYIALLEAQNEREAVLAQIEGFRSEQLINKISLEKELADTKKEADEEELERIKEKNELEQKAAEDKRQGIFDAMDAVAMAAGEESKIAKALFLLKTGMILKEQIMAAQATMQRILASAAESAVDGAKGFMKAASAAPPPANVPLIAIFAAQAAGIAMSIKSAVSTAKSMVGSKGGGVSGGGGSISAPQAPSFNVVGAAPENQLAQVIGQKEDKPIKAFVVSNDVTNAQALDRNIVEGASIG